MSGFLYFIAGNAAGRQFSALGLDGRLGSDGMEQLRVNADDSPTGMPGVVFTSPSPAGLPKPIDWHSTPDGKYWIGWHKHSRPGPDDLRNDVEAAGFNVELCDGNRWRVPLVVPFRDIDRERESGLPQVYALAGESTASRNGREYAETVKSEYMPLVEEAEKFLAALHDDSDAPRPDMVGYCARLLGVCYRIGLREMLALGLLDKECAEMMVFGSIDCGERYNAAIRRSGRC